MIPFNNFKLHYQNIKPSLDQAIARVMESGWYVLGKEVESFENEFSKFIGVKYSVGVASGTEAITLSLMANEISDNESQVTLKFNGEFNAMMAMMVKAPLTKFIGTLTENLEKL